MNESYLHTLSWRELKVLAEGVGYSKPDGLSWYECIPYLSPLLEDYDHVDKSSPNELVEINSEVYLNSESDGAISPEKFTEEPKLAEREDSKTKEEEVNRYPTDYYIRAGIPLGKDGDQKRCDLYGNVLNG